MVDRSTQEQADGAVLLAERRASDVQDVLQALEFDRAVDAEVGAGAARQLAGELDVHGDGAVLRRRVDADDLAGDDAVAGVDRGQLADGQVAGLGLGDAQLGLEAGRVGDAGHVGALGDLLADFDRHLLEHAGHAGAHAQLVDLLAAQVVEGAQLVDAGLLGQHLGAHALLGHGHALLLELRPGARATRSAPSTA